MSFIVLILIAALFPMVTSTRHPELSITREPQLKEGDIIPLFANKVLPHADDCEAYSYCELPFCPPGDPIPNREKSLQEILSGDCFTRTQYELKFKVRTVWETICEKTLTKDEVKKFRQAISNESEYHMYYNNVLLREKVRFVKPMGVTFNSRPSYYLVKHIDFYPQYYENQVVDISSVADLDSAVDITEDAEIRVRFPYSVFWKDSIIKPTKSISQNGNATMKQWWSSESCLLIFWFLNLCLVLLTLAKGMVEFLTTSSRSVPKDASFRPANPWLLAYILGLGVQLLLMAGLGFLFIWPLEIHDVRYPCNLGPITTLVLVYCLICSYYGCIDSSYGSDREKNIHSWKKYILYCVQMFIMVLLVNQVAKFAFESANFWTTAIFFCVSRLLAALSLPKNIEIAYGRQLQSRRPPTPLWQSKFTTRKAQMFLGGLFPFIVIFGNTDEIYAILFLLKLCGVYRAMFLSFFKVIIRTILTGAGFTAYQLRGKHVYWWWRSVLRGGSTAIFMFAYGIYFCCTVNEVISFPNLFYLLVYNACLCCIFFVALGAVGFYASLFASKAYYRFCLPKRN
ncbi:transmembrane 9 superfamily member [Citrus sinensis]|uniref:Transmembrane 9 superfamily member n=2 Tax=Citrus TaxID=2706 RepID=A0ACB8K0T3_CITSI|nr:transmembrane 9 superfamily member [Citrus sinensis]